MALVTTMLTAIGGSSGGGGGGGTTVPGTILAPVIAASTTALTVTYANGASGVGATLTNAGAQAAISLDGISPTSGQRVLIKDQASGLQNGVYTVTTVGTGATNWVLTRSTDFDEPGEVTVGVVVEIATGTVNGATLWEQTATVTTIGSSTITFTAMADAGYTASRALVTNSGGRVVVATTTATEIGYVNGVTSAIQTQLDAKLAAGNLSVSGNTISAANAGGDIVLTASTTGVVEIGANSTHASTLRFKEDTDNGTNFVSWAAGASLAGDTPYIYPLAYPAASGYVMASDTSGNTSWVPNGSQQWVDQTSTPVTVTANRSYVANLGSLITLNMPATAAVGDMFEVAGQGAGGWLLQMNTGQVANLGSTPTTSAGSLASTNRYDGVKLVCTVANTTFVAISAVGNITVA